MWYVYAILAIVLNLVWLFLTVLGLPGNWLMLATAGGLLWWYWKPGAPWDQQVFSLTTIIVLLALAVIGEILEFFTGMFGAKVGGGGKLSAFFSLVFSMFFGIGATFVLPVPVVGTLIGAIVGAFFGAWLGEHASSRDNKTPLKAGTGAAVGRLLGTVAKVGIGVTIYLVIAVTLFL